MSEEIGAMLPPPLRFDLGAHPSGEAAKAILLLTADADGAARAALIAASELSVRDESHVGLRLHAGSSTCANVKRSGQAALWCVLDAAAYCIRGSAAKIAPKTQDPDFETFELTVASVLRDFQAGAPMISGPTYRRLL